MDTTEDYDASYDHMQALIYDGDPDTRCLTAVTLTRIEADWAVDLLIRMLDDKDPKVMCAAISALGRRGDSKATSYLIPYTQVLDTEIVCCAIPSLCLIGDEQCFPPVVTALFSTDDEVRRNAAGGIGYLHDARAVEPLKMLLDDPVPWVRANAALSLAMVGDTQVSDALAARFAIEEDETTRGNLLIAMLACDPSKQSFVSSILANPEECEKVRVGACLAIERSVFERTLEDEDAALEMLDNLISSPDTSDDLQASIIWTIGKFERTPRITRILIDALESDYRWSVLYAVEALATQGSDTVIKALEAYRETHKDDEAIVERINIALEQVHLIDQQKAIADEVNEALDEALDSPISGEDENL